MDDACNTPPGRPNLQLPVTVPRSENSKQHYRSNFVPYRALIRSKQHRQSKQLEGLQGFLQHSTAEKLTNALIEASG